jgi:hypothetical protein
VQKPAPRSDGRRLASFWSSCPKGANDAVAGLCDFAPDTTVVAMIYLGRPVRDADIPERPPLPVRRITDSSTFSTATVL